jgi:HK97 family phage major capsid protein
MSPNVSIPLYKPPLALTPKEQRAYSIAGAIAEEAEAQLRKRQPASLAHDISQELMREMPPGTYHGGLLVPYSTRAGLDSKTSTKGQELAFGQDVTWRDMLRIESVVMRAGATFIDNLWGGPAGIPVITTQTAPTWQAQNPGSDATQSDPAFAQKTATPKSLMAVTAYTQQLLQQSRVNPNNAIDQLVATDIARAHAVLIDGAAIGGTGAGNQPTGVATQLAGAQLIALGANGLQPTWVALCDIEAAAAVANASGADTDDSDVWPKPLVNAWVTTPAIKQRLRKTDRSGGTTGWMILADENRCKLMSSPFYVSNSVPSTLTKGTSVGTCHAIVYGRWSDLYVCQFGPGIELQVDVFSKKKQGVIEVASYQMADILVAHTGSFSGALDALP